MNSDPYDSAAWRNFGMMDADESAIFDEAMRHDPLLRDAYDEMNRLSAAVAVATTRPVEPKAGQLERLQSRLGLAPTRRAYVLLGVSGWAAAAVLALLLALNHRKPPVDHSAENAPATGTIAKPSTPGTSATPALHPANGVETSNNGNVADNQPKSHDPSMANPLDGNSTASHDVARVETRRLVQEIEILRESLDKFQRRDRVLFEPTPGMALPVVMTMKPPSTTGDDGTIAKNDEHSPITAMLGDAIKAMNTPPGVGRLGEANALATNNLATASVAGSNPNLIDPLTNKPDNTANQTAANVQPTAVPIYDAARDTGTLVVSNLPKTKTGENYNLWATVNDEQFYIGSLPEGDTQGANSFDFSLGTTAIIPSGFLLTKDLKDKPTKPGATNTVLQGPPSKQ